MLSPGRRVGMNVSWTRSGREGGGLCLLSVKEQMRYVMCDVNELWE